MNVLGKRYGLGLQQHTEDPRDLQLADYWDYTTSDGMSGPGMAHEALAGQSPQVYGGAGIIEPGSLGMLLNDRIGDCFVADTMHALQVLGWLGGHHPEFDDEAAGKTYAELCGWNGTDEGTGTDVGCEPRTGLKHYHQVGLLRADGEREKIGAYLWLEPNNPEQLEAATKEFDWTGVAYDLTENAEEEAEDHRWRYVPGSPQIGRHWVAVVGGEDGGSFDTLTWGMVVSVERAYYERCSVAAATALSHAQLSGEGKTPEGFDFEKLAHDLRSVTA